uniref:D-isomer specific 2-hydroxyacid dehydrogenase catalytic domain-containing protein n=1 Tax=Fagus sylvatica TaxID=28930 RepID=A0A2N9H6L6_FAGSY
MSAAKILGRDCPMGPSCQFTTTTTTPPCSLSLSWRLKVEGRAGVGIDNVDISAATEHGCLVVNAPTANTIAAAEHRIALLAAMSRNIAQANASLKAGKWQRNKYVGVSLVGKTLAVMGFGKVGSEVARLVTSFITNSHWHPCAVCQRI